MQPKRHSLIEACSNVFSGMLLAFLISQMAHIYQAEIQEYVWKGFTWSISPGSNIIMTSIFTVISIVRGYIWRRVFNSRIKNLGESCE